MPPPPLSLPRYRDLSLRRQSRALGITGKAELFKHEWYVGINLCFSRDLVLKASLDGVCVTSVFETQPLLGRDGGRAASVPTSRAAGAPERQGPAVHSGLPRFSWYRCRVSKAMFRTSQGPNELKPHDGSWGPRGPRLWSSIKTKPQDLPPLTPRKRPGPAPEEATALLGPEAASPAREARAGRGGFPYGCWQPRTKKNPSLLRRRTYGQSPSPPSPPWAAEPLGGCVPTDSELIKSYLSSTVDTEASRLACFGRAAAKSSSFS